MADRPTLSLIVPTRGRPGSLRRFLHSLARTTSRPERIEVVLVVDEDDPGSHAITQPGLVVRHVIGPPGRTMGELNTAGHVASRGNYVMLLNDDVVVRTRRWDRVVFNLLATFPDRIALIHVNDTLMRDHLCTFPLVSRTFCTIAGGISPTAYQRYLIDDHIEDIFNLLAATGHRRIVYLPDVVFEHLNAVVHPEAGRVYVSDPAILAADAPLFDQLFPMRKDVVMRLLAHIEGCDDPERVARCRQFLDDVSDPFALRTPGRQLVVRAPRWRRVPSIVAGVYRRVRTRYRLGGSRGIIRAVWKRLVG